MDLLKKNTIKLAIQKDGRLTEDTINLLHTAGLEFETYKQRQKLFSPCWNFPLDIIYLRDDDIPNYIETGSADLGIVGRNLVIEKGVKVKNLLELGFGYCSLTLSVPENSKYSRIEDLKNKKVATAYPSSTKKFFQDKKIRVKVVNISGSVEVAPMIGVSDAIVDLVSTGSSLNIHDLTPIETILSSEAILIANEKSLNNTSKKEVINRLLLRLNGVLSAKRYKYVMMNIPEKALEKIRNLTPGLKSPTVVPLMKKGWLAVHSVVEEERFWEIIRKMKKAGAQGILVSSIEKMII